MKKNALRTLLAALVLVLGVSLALSHPRTQTTTEKAAASAASTALLAIIPLTQ